MQTASHTSWRLRQIDRRSTTPSRRRSDAPACRDRQIAPLTRRAQRGFTLIEIMVVVAIIAILGATVVPLIMDRPNEARVVRAKNDIATLSSALELYKLDNFNYPSTEQGLVALVEEPTGDPEPANWKRGGYIQKLPKDPWGREYIYLSPGENGDYDIISLGNDGAEGGEDFDEDISNWSE